MSESLHARIPSFDAPPSVGTALRVPTPPRGATLSPGHTHLPDAGQLADASASAPSIDWRLHFHERHKQALKRMHGAPAPPRVKLPQPKPDTRHQSPERRLEKVREAMKPETVTIIVTGYWGYHNLAPDAGRKTGHQIMREVANQTGITIAEMKSIRRNKMFVDARHLAMWRIRNECPHLSLPQIGRLFGGRDHTTIINACKKLDRLMQRGLAA